MALDADQQKHYDAVMTLARGSTGGDAFLEGGPGCGKTFLTSEIQLQLMSELDANILAIYPTHAARLVGIEQLRESTSTNLLKIADHKGEERPTQNVDVTVLYEGGSITFKTIQSALGMKGHQEPGDEKPVFKQTFPEAVKSRENFKYNFIFVDEVSMVSLGMVNNYVDDYSPTDTNPPKIISGILDIIEHLKKENKSFAPLLHFTGDFNQLSPVEGVSASEFFSENLDDFDVVTRLVQNHRAKESQGIVQLVDDLLERGTLPQDMEGFSNVNVFKKVKEFEDDFLNSVKNNGNDVLSLNYTNDARVRFSDLAAEAHGQRDQFFKGNSVIVSEGRSYQVYPRPTDPKDPTHVNLFYNGEKLKVVKAEGLQVVPSTLWAGDFAVKAHKCSVERFTTGDIYPVCGKSQFYFLDFLGSSNTDCPRKFYMDKVRHSIVRKLAPLESKAEEILSACDWDPYLLGEYLVSIDDFLGRMYDDLLETGMNTVERYLAERRMVGKRSKLFSKGNTGHSLFNLMWARYFFEVSFQVVPTVSENALTCHKAQGAGRNIVYLNAKGINKAPMASASTKKQLLYVGVSRAKKELNILV